MPSGGSMVPLVSTPILKPRACSASISAVSTCSSSSPQDAVPHNGWRQPGPLPRRWSQRAPRRWHNGHPACRRCRQIGVAKPAGRAGAVLLTAAPEIAACEPAEYRGPADMGAFALQGQKDFLDRVTHRVSPTNGGSGLPQRLAQRHGRGDRDIERTQPRPDPDQPRVGCGGDVVGDARDIRARTTGY